MNIVNPHPPASYESALSFQQQKRYLLYVREYEFVYCFIPKVGCTTLKRWIQELLGYPSDVHPQTDPKIVALSLDNYSNQDAINILQSGVFKFTFVRNPWNRLVSAFLNKFVSYSGHLKVAQRRSDFDFDAFFASYHEPFVTRVISLICPTSEKKKSGITFREFVKFIVEQPDTHLDQHWRPQTAFLAGISFDFLGKLERFEEDFKIIQHRMGLQRSIQLSENVTSYKLGVLKPLMDVPTSNLVGRIGATVNYLDESLIECIRKRYAGDVALGYESP